MRDVYVGMVCFFLLCLGLGIYSDIARALYGTEGIPTAQAAATKKGKQKPARNRKGTGAISNAAPAQEVAFEGSLMSTAGLSHPFLKVLAVKPPVPSEDRLLSDEQLAGYLKTCSMHDPLDREHPENALMIVQMASELIGTDFGLMLAKWWQESSFSTGGAVGKYPMKVEAPRRDAAEPRAHHWQAVKDMSVWFQWKPEEMTGSPPDHTEDGAVYGFGASWSPFQTSPGFVRKDVEAYGINPLTLCGGALYGALHLKRSHDWWMQRHSESSEAAAWEWAVKAYAGKPTEPCDGRPGEDKNVCGYRRTTARKLRTTREWISSGNLQEIIAAKVSYEM